MVYSKKHKTRLEMSYNTYPLLGPFGTRKGRTIPTTAQNAVIIATGNADAAILRERSQINVLKISF